jgi:hypothetical protein
MGQDINTIGILTRREIEARIAGPLIRAFMAEVGKERALRVVGELIGQVARDSGEQLARALGGNGIDEFFRGLELWTRDDALQMEIVERDKQRLSFDVKRCRYAEMYRTLGMEDLGSVLSCNRDFAFVRGFNPRISLRRTRTIMGGDALCDFRYRLT